MLGWSMGGMIAQALAVLHPAQVRHLVLCATYPGSGQAVMPPVADLQAASDFPANQASALNAFKAAIAQYPPAPAASTGTTQLDPVANDQTLARIIPGARLVLYPDAGHAFLFQDWSRFAALVNSFLAGNQSP